MEESIRLIKTTPSKDYALIDSGNGMKLERFGDFTLARPDPEALWQPLLSKATWSNADATFLRDGKSTKWQKKKSLPESWEISFGGLSFEIKPTSFKHTGLFPEQSGNWTWIENIVSKQKRDISVLNLFGYTGGASLASARAGATVTHVDGSKSAITWARKNQELSGLADKPIRWILDDAILFLKREVKRGNHYDAIIMDPPKFGHGPNGELWKIEEHFQVLLDLVAQVLSPKPLFLIINGYASGYSPTVYKNTLLPFQKKYGGTIETGELVIVEEKTNRLLPAGIVARWNTSST